MNRLSLEERLIQVEAHFNTLSLALVDGTPECIQHASAQFQQAVMNLGRSPEIQKFPADAKHRAAARVRLLAQSLPTLREVLLRKSAVVEHALQIVVPATRNTTYSRSAAIFGAGPRASGEFESFKA